MIEALAEALQAAGFSVVARRGRFAEEWNLEVHLGGRRVAVVKAFAGRPPHYGPWAEVFGLEGWEGLEPLLRALHMALPPGAVLYVEYGWEPETWGALQRGARPADTPLGRLLERAGFRVVRDWYFPEGWLEGGQKLEARRP